MKPTQANSARTIVRYVTLSLIAGLATLCTWAAEFRLSTGYSTTNNPNQVWSYGWKETLGGSFSLLTYRSVGIADNGQPVHALAYAPNTHPAIFFNAGPEVAIGDGGQGQFPPGTVWYTGGHDGAAQNFGVIRFTAPSNGVYRIGVGVQAYLDGPSSGDADFYVVRNSKQVNGWFLPSRAGTNYTNTLILASGDTLDFAVGRGADNRLAGSGLKIDSIITLVSNLPPAMTNEPPKGHSFDVARDFSTNTNPNGVWSYGWKTNLNGNLTRVTETRTAWADNGVPYQVLEYQTYGTPPYFLFFPFTNTITGTSDNGQGQYAPGTLMFFPGFNAPLNYGVIRFTAPSNGNYKIGVAVRAYLDGPRSGDASFHIVRNGDAIFNQPLGPLAGTAYTNILSLLAGQTVDFAVGRGADDSLHGSGLKISALITATTNAPGTNHPPVIHPDFNASRDFTTNSNPNGVWSYGWKSNLVGSFNLLTFFRTAWDDNGFAYQLREIQPGGLPGVYFNHGTNTLHSDGGQGVYPPRTLWFYPGTSQPLNFGAIRFTAPSNGNYHVGVAVRAYLEGSSSGDTDFHIIRNSAELLGAFLSSSGRTNYTNVLSLSTGDTLDFLVGRGADNVQYGSGLKIEAVVTPTTNAPTGTNPPTLNSEFSLSRDFAVSTNPRGPWSYGWKERISGPFGLLGSVRTFSSDNGVPILAWELNTYNLPVVAKVTGNSTAVSDGGRFTAEPGTVYFAPGADGTPQNFGVIRFTVPTNGNYRVESTVRSLFDGSRSRDSDFHIAVNGGELHSVFLPPNFGTNSYSAVLTLRQGDAIDFAIGRGADGVTLDTGLKISAVITATTNAATVTNPPVVVHGDFNLSRDFLMVTNPAGPWSYGWKQALNGSFATLSSVRTFSSDNGVPIRAWELSPYNLPVVAKVTGVETAVSDGGRFTARAGTVYFAPGADATPQNFGVVRFTVPSNGNYHVESSVNPLFGGDRSRDSDFHVVRNGTELHSAFLPPNFGTNRYSAVLALNAGDSVDFAIGRGADGVTLDTGLKLSVVITPTTNAPSGTNVSSFGNFHLTRDFSTNTNPNGVWTYGWKSTFASPLNKYIRARTSAGENGVPVQVLDTGSFALPVLYFNPTTNTTSSDGGQAQYPPRTLWYYPGNTGSTQNFGAIRFTALSNGNYHVGVAVRAYLDGANSGDTDFHVVRNGTEVFGQFLPGNGATSYTNVFSLIAGDVLDFLVGRGTDNSSAASGLKIDALVTPTPAAPIANAPGETKSAQVSSFERLENGDIQFTVTGDVGTAYVIEASSDLTTWIEVGVVVNTSGTLRFTDPDAAASPSRFYRARQAGQ